MWFLKLLGYGHWWGPKKASKKPADAASEASQVTLPTPPSAPSPAPQHPFRIALWSESESCEGAWKDAGGAYSDRLLFCSRWKNSKRPSKYGPTLAHIHPVNGDAHMTEEELFRFAQQVKAAKFFGTCTDTENWLAELGHLEQFLRAGRAAGLKVWAAPKATMELTGYPYFGLPFEKAVAEFARVTDGMLLWKYDWMPPQWAQLVARVREAGYTGEIVCLTEGQARGNLTEAQIIETLEWGKTTGQSIGLFKAISSAPIRHAVQLIS